MICEIYGIYIGRFNILWLILGIIVGTRTGEDTGNGRDASERHGSCWYQLVTNRYQKDLRHRVIHPVS